jgi:EmrB/QacA subfamily drug resistance transporter
MPSAIGSGIEPRQRNVALLVAGCFFMENLDGTIVTTAAPRIGASLHVAATSAGLVITAYLMTLAVLIPLSAWMTSRFGARRVLLGAIALFTGASLGCALSSTLGELVAMRVLQGCGGAMMVPVGRLLVLADTAKSDLMRMMSFVIWPGLVAPIIAPLAGGLITTYASWRWIFLINLPLGVVALGAAGRLIVDGARGRPRPLDRLGLLLTGGGLAGVAYLAHLLSDTSPSWGLVAAVTLATSALLASSIRHLRRSSAPLVNLRVLANRTLRASLTGSTVLWIAVGAMPFLLTLLFQEHFGWSPVHAGAVVLAIFVGDVAIKPAVNRLLNRFGFRAIISVAAGCLALTAVAASVFSRSTPVAVIFAVVLLSGVARSLGLGSYTILSYSEVPAAEMGDATALAATAQQLAAGLGIAAATVALSAGRQIASMLSSAPRPGGSYAIAFVFIALVALVALVASLRLDRAAGAVLRTRSAPVA